MRLALIGLALVCAALAWDGEQRAREATQEAAGARQALARLSARVEAVEGRSGDVDALLGALRAGRSVRCAWEMVPASGQTWLADTAALVCSRVEPCVATLATALDFAVAQP